MRADLARAHQVTLVTHEDDGSLRLSLPQEKPQLSGAVETAPVGHGEHQDTNFTLQSRQVLQRGQKGTESPGIRLRFSPRRGGSGCPTYAKEPSEWFFSGLFLENVVCGLQNNNTNPQL